jgi:hypothetical protein
MVKIMQKMIVFLWVFKNFNPSIYRGLFLVWKEICFIKCKDVINVQKTPLSVIK